MTVPAPRLRPLCADFRLRASRTMREYSSAVSSHQGAHDFLEQRQKTDTNAKENKSGVNGGKNT